MKRLIYIILLIIPAFCWGQGVNVVHMPTRPALATAAGVSLGSELITNGTFDSDLSGWEAFHPNWAWQTDGGGGGWARHTTGAGSSFTQDCGVSAGKTYRVIYKVGGMTQGNIRCIVGNGGVGTTRTANGTYEEDVAYSGSGSTFFMQPLDGTFDGYVDDVSVKEIL